MYETKKFRSYKKAFWTSFSVIINKNSLLTDNKKGIVEDFA